MASRPRDILRVAVQTMDEIAIGVQGGRQATVTATHVNDQAAFDTGGRQDLLCLGIVDGKRSRQAGPNNDSEQGRGDDEQYHRSV
jgi:hypothetical protein